MRIKLKYGYSIQIDRRNYTLRKVFVKRRPNQTYVAATKIIGYYPDLSQCVEKYITECQDKLASDAIFDLHQYAEFIKYCNQTAVADLVTVLSEMLKQRKP